MKERKTLTVEIETWQKLTHLKAEQKAKTLDEVINNLMVKKSEQT